MKFNIKHKYVLGLLYGKTGVNPNESHLTHKDSDSTLIEEIILINKICIPWETLFIL